MKIFKILIASIIAASVISSTVMADANKYVNPYNTMDFINTSNRTLGEIAVEKNITVDEFKAMFELPEDMNGDTNEAAAFYNMTVENVAKMYGIDVDSFVKQIKESVATDIDITKDTLYNDAYCAISIKNHIGDLSFDEFKKAYALDDSITENSTIGEIRNDVFRKQLAFSGELSYFSSDDILVMAAGKYLDFDVAPTIINDRTMVPMRNIIEYFDAEVAWDGETKTIIAKTGENVITMQIGQSSFFFNSTKIELDSPSVIINDRTLVPVRAISEALSREVSYNENTKTVIIH